MRTLLAVPVGYSLATPYQRDDGWYPWIGFEYWTPRGILTGKALNGYALTLDLGPLSAYRNGATAPYTYTVKVARTTNDQSANSLIRDEFRLQSYQEVIRAPLLYSNTATALIEGTSTAFDARIPQFTYELDGLKVEVPTGYTAGVSMPAVWDGTFKSAKEFVDDPAWHLWDLLRNNGTGAG